MPEYVVELDVSGEGKVVVSAANTEEARRIVNSVSFDKMREHFSMLGFYAGAVYEKTFYEREYNGDPMDPDDYLQQ